MISLLFLSIFPILFLFNQNRKELYFSQTFIPIIISLAACLFLSWILQLLLKNKQKSYLLVNLSIVLFYSFGHLHNYLKNFSLVRENELFQQGWILLILLIIIYYLLFILFSKKSFNVRRTNNFFSLLSVVLFLNIIIQLAINIKAVKLFSTRAAIIKTNPAINSEQVKNYPDIYYIIPDRYINNQIAKKYYSFDNGQFSRFLTAKGFYVSEDSFANYPKTWLSMASALNLRYLADLTVKYGPDYKDWKPAFDLVENNFVQNYLRAKGYQFIYLGGWWGPTQQNRNADLNYNLYGKSDDFFRQLAATTALLPLTNTKLARYLPAIASGDQMKRENIKHQFYQLAEIAKSRADRPRFILAHIFIPHYPYIFNNKCNNQKDLNGRDEKAQYIKQLQCTNIFLTEAIDKILLNSKQPPVIILQSDEGPFKYDEFKRSGEGVDWTKVSAEAIETHMLIFNAYYFPPLASDSTTIINKNQQLYPGISPVNSFRIVFNRYFNENYPLLSDKAYFIPHLDRSYDYYEVTEKLN